MLRSSDLQKLLCAVFSTCVSGCVVAEGPDYTLPERTAPVIDVPNVQPSPYELLVLDLDNRKNTVFEIPVRSEDAGDPLRGAFFEDYLMPGKENARAIDDRSFAPSTFDVVRVLPISFDNFSNAPTEGCHLITFMLLHESGWSTSSDIPDPVKSAGDISTVTWLADVINDPPDPNRAPCPTIPGEPPI